MSNPQILCLIAFGALYAIALILLQPWNAPTPTPFDYINPGTVLQQQGSGK